MHLPFLCPKSFKGSHCSQESTLSVWTQASPRAGPNFLATSPVSPTSHYAPGKEQFLFPERPSTLRPRWLVSLLPVLKAVLSAPHLATIPSISHANYLFLCYGIWLLTSSVPLLSENSINLSKTAQCLQLVYIHVHLFHSIWPVLTVYNILHWLHILHLLQGVSYSHIPGTHCCLPIRIVQDSQDSIWTAIDWPQLQNLSLANV